MSRTDLTEEIVLKVIKEHKCNTSEKIAKFLNREERWDTVIISNFLYILFLKNKVRFDALHGHTKTTHVWSLTK